MGLTSNVTLALAMLSALLLFAGTVWWWPRLAGRGWRAVSGRAGILLATQVAVFVSVAIAANQAFGFYSSWADLLGQENGQGVVVAHNGAGVRGPVQVLDT